MKIADITPHTVYAASSKPGFDRWAEPLYVLDTATKMQTGYPYGIEAARPGKLPVIYLGIRAKADYFTEHADTLAKLDADSLLGNNVDDRIPTGGTVVLFRPQEIKDVWTAHLALVEAAIGESRARGIAVGKANAQRRATIAEIKAAIADRDIDPRGIRATYRASGEVTMPVATLQALLGIGAPSA